MFSGPEHRFLPLNLDWSPKSVSEGKDWNPRSFFEGKCQRKLKLNFEMKYKYIIFRNEIFQENQNERPKINYLLKFIKINEFISMH